MVGRLSRFLLGEAYFQGRTVSFREGIECIDSKPLAFQVAQDEVHRTQFLQELDACGALDDRQREMR